MPDDHDTVPSVRPRGVFAATPALHEAPRLVPAIMHALHGHLCRASLGRARSVLSIDVFNALNSDAVLTVNQNYASWLTPQSILNARLLKFSVQFDF